MTSRSDTRQEKEAQAARGPLTLLCYAILYLLGCTLIAQGILILYVSKTYEISLAHVGYLCLVPAVVQAVTTFLNGFILHRANLKRELLVGLASVAAGIGGVLSGWLPLLLVGLLPLGYGYGILISVCNYLIVSLHPENKFQKLNILNFAFSAGGIAGPAFLGRFWALAFPGSWPRPRPSCSSRVLSCTRSGSLFRR